MTIRATYLHCSGLVAIPLILAIAQLAIKAFQVML